jgi:15-cis-phytoene synthase
MDTYTRTAFATSRLFTERYSTSFAMASRMFGQEVRPHIYAIYGLTRVADEIVDTYRGTAAAQLLRDFQTETMTALHTGYSTNPIIHAFAVTAQTYAIDHVLLDPFFASMATDLDKTTFTQHEYEQYIHGSAEVVGLMCLKVFCGQDQSLYAQLKTPAARLGAAYQKVNFLRDVADDYTQLGRCYFPNTSFETFDDAAKQNIIADIEQDFAAALPAFKQLPRSARPAVVASYRYYSALLAKLNATPAVVMKQKRVRVSNVRKLMLALPGGIVR